MLSMAVNVVAEKCFGIKHKIEPGALMSDHSDGCRAGMLAVWPDVPHGQCWPHIRRKLGEGAFCSKKHPHFDEIVKHLTAVHMCQSDGMRDFIIHEIGKVWESWGKKWNMRSFWNEYMVEPWDNWSIGLFDCMLCTPSQQAQESWHKQILQSRIPGMFKGSTEHVMTTAMPMLVEMDATLKPDALQFSIPMVPPAMWQKAKWYAPRKDERLWIQTETDDDDGDETVYWFHVLSASCTHWKKISDSLVARYNSLLMGERPRGLTTLDKYIQLIDAIHVVQYAVDAGRTCPPCPANPGELVCTCKGFRHVGICSHVIAVNHWLGKHDLAQLMGTISGEKKRKRGGFNKGVRPALIPEKAGAQKPASKKAKKKPSLASQFRSLYK